MASGMNSSGFGRANQRPTDCSGQRDDMPRLGDHNATRNVWNYEFSQRSDRRSTPSYWIVSLSQPSGFSVNTGAELPSIALVC